MKTNKRHFWLLGGIMFVLICYCFSNWWPNNAWNRLIIGDGKGYYAYLPAVFIYNDSSYDFTKGVEKKYYPEDGSLAKGFYHPSGEGVVNQYFCGLALLWLPFFLLAHFLSYLLGFPTDGYSLLYQFSICVASLSYLCLGLIALFKTGKHLAIKEKPLFIALFCLVFGTNLFHYAVDAPFMSHVYSFSCISLFLYVLCLLDKQITAKRLYSLAIISAIIVLLRPTNAVVFLCIPFIFNGLKPTQKIFLTTWNTKRTPLLIAALIFLAVVSVQLFLWKWQSNQWIVDSYADEGFHFLNPQFSKVLFSIRKGWLVYTPMATFFLLGIALMIKQAQQRAWFLLIFLLLALYIVSCWHLWAYADSFGQRPLIDYYGILVLPFAWLIQRATNANRLIAASLFTLLTGCILLNQIQNYQLKHFILKADKMDWTSYKQHFLQLAPNARVELNELNKQLVRGEFYDMELLHSSWVGWENTSSLQKAHSGKISCKIGTLNPFSITYHNSIDSSVNYVLVEAYLHTNHTDIQPKLVIDIQDENQSSLSYSLFELKPYLQYNRWFKVEFGVSLSPTLPKNNKVAIYFWYPEAEEEKPLFIDDIGIQMLNIVP
jgi:hypothetical protein